MSAEPECSCSGVNAPQCTNCAAKPLVMPTDAMRDPESRW